MERVLEFLKNAKTYYVATVEGDQPRVRPFGTIDLFEGKLYIQTGRIKPCYKQMKANPKIEICAMNGGEWIRIACEAVEGPYEAEVHMLEEYPSLGRMYKAGDGNTVVFSLENATATISSFTADPVVIKF